jgi:hypothetical protein
MGGTAEWGCDDWGGDEESPHSDDDKPVETTTETTAPSGNSIPPVMDLAIRNVDDCPHEKKSFHKND